MCRFLIKLPTYKLVVYSEFMAGVKGIVLVIDDDKDLLETTQLLLQSVGFEAIAAQSAQTAIGMISDRAQKNNGTPHLDAIFVDWKMPEMDGLDFLRAIRASEFAQLPIVLMSGAVTRDELIDAAKNGADAVLVKPFTKDDLSQKVSEARARRQMKKL